MDNDTAPIIITYRFWLKYIVLIALCLFFGYIGVYTLIWAYQLTDPFSFVMTFFASNFIILFSLTLIIVFVYNIIATVKPKTPDKESVAESLPQDRP